MEVVSPVHPVEQNSGPVTRPKKQTEGNAEGDYYIRWFEPSGFSNAQLKREFKSQPTRKVSYNYFNQKLKVYSMAPSALHNVVSNFVGHFLLRCCRDGFFDDYEALDFNQKGIY